VPAALWYSKISVGKREQELEEQWGEKRKVTWTRYATWQPRWQSNNRVSCHVERRVVTVMEIFVFKWFQPVLFGLFEFDLEMTLSVIDPMNLRYRWVIAAKKGTCEPVANNLVTANWLAPFYDDACNCNSHGLGVSHSAQPGQTHDKSFTLRRIQRIASFRSNSICLRWLVDSSAKAVFLPDTSALNGPAHSVCGCQFFWGIFCKHRFICTNSQFISHNHK
jgi:hypothetical protein